MFGVSDAAWRVLLLFAEAIAPWGAPVEAAPGAHDRRRAGATRARRRALRGGDAWTFAGRPGGIPGVAALAMLAALRGSRRERGLQRGSRAARARGLGDGAARVGGACRDRRGARGRRREHGGASGARGSFSGPWSLRWGWRASFAGRSRLCVARRALAERARDRPGERARGDRRRDEHDAADQRAAALDVLLTCASRAPTRARVPKRQRGGHRPRPLPRRASPARRFGLVRARRAADGARRRVARRHAALSTRASARRRA